METNNVSPQKKSTILNSLAVTGFVAIVLILAWLSIQLVQLFPNAVTSLASLAEGVNQSAVDIDTEPEIEQIVVTSNTSLLKTGENLNINWNKSDANGSYVFAYDCIDGVAISQVEGTVERQLDCDTNYNVGDIVNLTLAIESEKNRYTDVTYNVSFLQTNDTTPRAIGSDVVTVINEEVNVFAQNTFTETLSNESVVTETEETENESEVAVEEPVVTTPVTPTTPTTPVFEQEFVFAIPTSDPNGTTDLRASYVAMGEVISNRFVPGPVSTENDGAIQFAVKNIGTKTSNDWSFTISLPNGGEYNSPTQVALKPNEEAVLTIGFPATEDDTAHTFEVEVDVSGDRNSGNDSFTQRVTFAN